MKINFMIDDCISIEEDNAIKEFLCEKGFEIAVSRCSNNFTLVNKILGHCIDISDKYIVYTTNENNDFSILIELAKLVDSDSIISNFIIEDFKIKFFDTIEDLQKTLKSDFVMNNIYGEEVEMETPFYRHEVKQNFKFKDKWVEVKSVSLRARDMQRRKKVAYKNSMTFKVSTYDVSLTDVKDEIEKGIDIINTLASKVLIEGE